MEIVDPTLHLSEEEAEDVHRVIQIALLCNQMAGEKRPTMARIVSMLQNDTQSEVAVVGGGYETPTSWAQLNSGLTTVSEESEWSNSHGATGDSLRLTVRRGNTVTSDVGPGGIRAR